MSSYRQIPHNLPRSDPRETTALSEYRKARTLQHGFFWNQPTWQYEGHRIGSNPPTIRWKELALAPKARFGNQRYFALICANYGRLKPRPGTFGLLARESVASQDEISRRHKRNTSRNTGSRYRIMRMVVFGLQFPSFDRLNPKTLEGQGHTKRLLKADNNIRCQRLSICANASRLKSALKIVHSVLMIEFLHSDEIAIMKSHNNHVWVL